MRTIRIFSWGLSNLYHSIPASFSPASKKKITFYLSNSSLHDVISSHQTSSVIIYHIIHQFLFFYLMIYRPSFQEKIWSIWIVSSYLCWSNFLAIPCELIDISVVLHVNLVSAPMIGNTTYPVYFSGCRGMPATYLTPAQFLHTFMGCGALVFSRNFFPSIEPVIVRIWDLCIHWPFCSLVLFFLFINFLI